VPASRSPHACQWIQSRVRAPGNKPQRPRVETCPALGESARTKPSVCQPPIQQDSLHLLGSRAYRKVVEQASTRTQIRITPTCTQSLASGSELGLLHHSTFWHLGPGLVLGWLSHCPSVCRPCRCLVKRDGLVIVSWGPAAKRAADPDSCAGVVADWCVAVPLLDVTTQASRCPAHP
jgi:hypothetical protein